MKIMNFVLVGIFLLLISVTVSAQTLDSIESKIENAFLEFGRSGKKTSIEKIIGDLKTLRSAKSKEAGSAIHYWYGFVLYRYAILTALTNDKESEKLIDESIESVSSIKNMNSEHYALLSLQKGFSLQFSNAIALSVQAPKVAELARKAIALNASNPRAHLALASYDFYTPAIFGGGKIVEGELLKALSLPLSYDPNPLSPSWGLRDIYRLLLSLFEARKDETNLLKFSREMIANKVYDSYAYTAVIDYYFETKNEAALEKYAIEAIQSPLPAFSKMGFYKSIINHYIRIADKDSTRRMVSEAFKLYPSILPWLKERSKKFPEHADWLQFINDLKPSS